MKLALTTVFGFLLGSTAVDGPFREATFEEALIAAKAEEKVVMIDFFTTWCPPCKKLDETTWKDAAVNAWLDEHTIALKLDAEIEVDLAARYKIEAYPTMLFVRADGSVMDRMVGYRAAEAFLAEAGDVLIGRKAIDRAREAVVGKEEDAMARMSFGDALVVAGNYEEALAEYLWCFDHGSETTVGYGGVRLSFLLSSIESLSRKYPPAREALVKRRDLAHRAVVDNGETGLVVLDLTSLSRTLGDEDYMLRLYDELVALGDRSQTISELMSTVAPLLVKERRYEEVARGLSDLDAWLEMQAMMINSLEGMEGNMEGVLPMMLARVMGEGGVYYEALLGAGQLEGVDQLSAVEFEGRLIGLDGSSQNYARLIKHAVKAKGFDRARALLAQAEGLFTDEKELKRVRRAGKKIPALEEEE